MIGEQEVRTYRRDGVIVVPDVLEPDVLARMRQVLAQLVADSVHVAEHTDVYDLEPGHAPDDPRVRRIKAPHKVHPVFEEVVRSPQVIAILQALLGPGVRLHNSKLNLKSARYGSPVEWHQDWAFYPHTNDDVLAVGVMLDDMEMSNGPMLVTPGSHAGPVFNHHDRDGRFAGMIDPDDIRPEIARAVPCLGRAGSMSFHHVRALHGSALNTSDRARSFLLYEVSAADAWPLLGLRTDWASFADEMLAGEPVLQPRMKDLPVRLPYPPPLRGGSIYETQSVATNAFFNRAA